MFKTRKTPNPLLVMAVEEIIESCLSIFLRKFTRLPFLRESLSSETSSKLKLSRQKG